MLLGCGDHPAVEFDLNQRRMIRHLVAGEVSPRQKDLPTPSHLVEHLHVPAGDISEAPRASQNDGLQFA